MSEPTLDYTPGEFIDRHGTRIVMGDPTYAYRPMLSWEQRFPPLRKKAEPPAPGRLFAAPRPQPAASYTYLVAAEGSNFVKIGWAKEPWKRVAYLQTGSPVALSVLWKLEGPYESALHAEFAKYRVRGEWFDFTEVGDPVEAVKAAVERIKASQEQADAE
jgi:hypothetical protein